MQGKVSTDWVAGGITKYNHSFCCTKVEVMLVEMIAILLPLHCLYTEANVLEMCELV